MKALTSTGKRLDVACRMIRAALRASDAGTRVTCWFAGEGGCIERVTIHREGMNEPGTREALSSELRLASTIEQPGPSPASIDGLTWLRTSRVEPPGGFSGAVLGDLLATKQAEGHTLVLLNEHGRRALHQDEDGTLFMDADAWSPRVGFIVGSHDGFPGPLEHALREACDDEICLATAAGDAVSYLGSHVVSLLRALLSRGTDHQSVA